LVNVGKPPFVVRELMGHSPFTTHSGVNIPTLTEDRGSYGTMEFVANRESRRTLVDIPK
jgi:hypothetical protein